MLLALELDALLGPTDGVSHGPPAYVFLGAELRWRVDISDGLTTRIEVSDQLRWRVVLKEEV